MKPRVENVFQLLAEFPELAEKWNSRISKWFGIELELLIRNWKTCLFCALPLWNALAQCPFTIKPLCNTLILRWCPCAMPFDENAWVQCLCTMIALWNALMRCPCLQQPCAAPLLCFVFVLCLCAMSLCYACLCGALPRRLFPLLVWWPWTIVLCDCLVQWSCATLLWISLVKCFDAMFSGNVLARWSYAVWNCLLCFNCLAAL